MELLFVTLSLELDVSRHFSPQLTARGIKFDEIEAHLPITFPLPYFFVDLLTRREKIKLKFLTKLQAIMAQRSVTMTRYHH